jgi:hypothetical protein
VIGGFFMPVFSHCRQGARLAFCFGEFDKMKLYAPQTVAPPMAPLENNSQS